MRERNFDGKARAKRNREMKTAQETSKVHTYAGLIDYDTSFPARSEAEHTMFFYKAKLIRILDKHRISHDPSDWEPMNLFVITLAMDMDI